MRVASCLVAALCLLARPAWADPAPDWAASLTDIYVGREWNGGVMACARTVFTLQNGTLTGHYWIGDGQDPFEGDLKDFVPGAGHTGTFTWVDRYGEGPIVVRFGEDGQTFFSLWGDQPSTVTHPGYGLRGADATVPGCRNAPTS
jgi:hypothetical protein